jgi:hypothetical protein
MPQMKEFFEENHRAVASPAKEDRSSLQPAYLQKGICANLCHLRIPG